MNDMQSSNAHTKTKRVGYWMTEKKLRRLSFDAFETLCRLVCHYTSSYNYLEQTVANKCA